MRHERFAWSPQSCCGIGIYDRTTVDVILPDAIITSVTIVRQIKGIGPPIGGNLQFRKPTGKSRKLIVGPHHSIGNNWCYWSVGKVVNTGRKAAEICARVREGSEIRLGK